MRAASPEERTKELSQKVRQAGPLPGSSKKELATILEDAGHLKSRPQHSSIPNASSRGCRRVRRFCDVWQDPWKPKRRRHLITLASKKDYPNLRSNGASSKEATMSDVRNRAGATARRRADQAEEPARKVTS